MWCELPTPLPLSTALVLRSLTPSTTLWSSLQLSFKVVAFVFLLRASILLSRWGGISRHSFRSFLFVPPFLLPDSVALDLAEYGKASFHAYLFPFCIFHDISETSIGSNLNKLSVSE